MTVQMPLPLAAAVFHITAVISSNTALLGLLTKIVSRAWLSGTATGSMRFPEA